MTPYSLCGFLWLLAQTVEPDERVKCMSVAYEQANDAPSTGGNSTFDKPTERTYQFSIQNRCGKDVVSFTITRNRLFGKERHNFTYLELDMTFRADGSRLDPNAPDLGGFLKSGSVHRYRGDFNPPPLDHLDIVYISAALFTDGTTLGNGSAIQSLLERRCDLRDGFYRIQHVLDVTSDFSQARYYCENNPNLPAGNPFRSPSAALIRGFNAEFCKFLKTGDTASWDTYHASKKQWVATNNENIEQLLKQFKCVDQLR